MGIFFRAYIYPLYDARYESVLGGLIGLCKLGNMRPFSIFCFLKSVLWRVKHTRCCSDDPSTGGFLSHIFLLLRFAWVRVWSGGTKDSAADLACHRSLGMARQSRADITKVREEVLPVLAAIRPNLQQYTYWLH